jgi:hypothetical protein
MAFSRKNDRFDRPIRFKRNFTDISAVSKVPKNPELLSIAGAGGKTSGAKLCLDPTAQPTQNPRSGFGRAANSPSVTS